MAKREKSKTKSAAAKAAPEQTFEQALHRLEEIVTGLEHGEAPLEKALTLYEEGIKLVRFCTEQLSSAERRVEILEDKKGEMRSRPFKAAGDEDEADEGKAESGSEDGEEEAGADKEENGDGEDETAEDEKSDESPRLF